MKTKAEIIAAGFAKIGQDTGGTLICATFYNVETKECFSEVVRDYDYSDCSRDNDQLYRMPIDKDALRRYNVDNNIVFEGATVIVVKGRKVPIGTVAKVEKIAPWYDRYGRIGTTYAYLDNGMRTNIHNCEVIA